MNLDEHPYLSIYLAGCLAAFCLHFVSAAGFFIVEWASKDDVLKKNLNKIKDPSQQGFKFTAIMFSMSLVAGTVVSWLGVLLYLWVIFWTPLIAIRGAFSSVPEEIKLLRFPLKNNPNLTREAVWAYAYALGVKAGTIPDPMNMAWELGEIGGYYPSFNSHVALETLRSLGGVDHETLSEALAHMRNAKEVEVMV